MHSLLEYAESLAEVESVPLVVRCTEVVAIQKVVRKFLMQVLLQYLACSRLSLRRLRSSYMEVIDKCISNSRRPSREVLAMRAAHFPQSLSRCSTAGRRASCASLAWASIGASSYPVRGVRGQRVH